VTRSDEDEDFVQAPVRRVRALKPLLADARIELSNHNLRHLDRDYLVNMAAAAEQKVNGRAVAQAKRNADFWIWQMGVSGIGRDGGAAVAPGLDMFYGQNFIHAVLGIAPTPQGEKRDRASAEGDQSDEEGRRVRPRTESPRDDEVGRGNADAMLDDDGLPAINNDLVSPSISQCPFSVLIMSRTTSRWAAMHRHLCQVTQAMTSPQQCPGTFPPLNVDLLYSNACLVLAVSVLLCLRMDVSLVHLLCMEEASHFLTGSRVKVVWLRGKALPVTPHPLVAETSASAVSALTLTSKCRTSMLMEPVTSIRTLQ